MPLDYSSILGKKASGRLQEWICPNLPWNQERYGNLLLSFLNAKPNGRWLEAGCGRRVLPDGLISIETAAIKKAGMVVGMDADWHGLASHRSVALRANATLDEVPFANGTFDIVGCNMVAEHLSDPRRSLAELARVLKPGGVLLIHTPNLHNYMIFLNHTLARIVPRRWILSLIHTGDGREADDVFPTLYRMNSAEKLQALARDLGLRVHTLEFLPSPRPFFVFFWPLALVQLLLTRLFMLPPFRRFQSTILIALQKPVDNMR